MSERVISIDSVTAEMARPASASGLNYRLLPADEWHRLGVVYEECRADEPLPLPDPTLSNIIVAEDRGRLVGCVGAEKSWNVSPFWVERSFRGQGIAEALASEIVRTNTEGLPALLVTTNAHVELLVYNMGFSPVSGTLWRLKQ